MFRGLGLINFRLKWKILNIYILKISQIFGLSFLHIPINKSSLDLKTKIVLSWKIFLKSHTKKNYYEFLKNRSNTSTKLFFFEKKMLRIPWYYGISKLNLESFILIMSKIGIILLAMGQLMWFNLELFIYKCTPCTHK
jgi:hypothetical protein